MRVRISSVPVLFYFWRCCVISNREHQINEAVRYEVLPDTFDGGYVSDHAPVMAVVKIAK